MVDPNLVRLSDNLFWIALTVYTVSMVLFFFGLAYRRRGVGAVATLFAWVGAAVHATSIATRGLAAERVPWGNMFEYSSMVGLVIVLAYLLFADRRFDARSVGGFATGAAVLSLASARFVYAPPGPLVPALDSYWIKIHVIAAIAGSSLFGISFIFTALYLLKDRVERRAEPLYAQGTVGAARLGTAAPPSSSEEGLPADFAGDAVAGPRKLAGGMWGRIPPSETFDRLSLATVKFAFPIWTFAVIAGAIWAHEAWGRYWGWDPKETWAFITWVVYAAYLHARSTMGWRGRKAAALASVGFVSLMITYWAVNLWITGLHSYAGV